MASNTIIQILRSYANTSPAALHDGEQAYSFVSNTLFIGNGSGGIFEIGGQKYTDIINAATSLANNNTLVQRSANGSASFYKVYGSLGSSSGVTAGTYGDQTHIPVVTVAANGLVTGVTTSEISTSLDIAGDTGSNTLSLITDTLTISGTDYIQTSVTGNDITVDITDKVVVANTAGAYQTIDGVLNISGDLNVTGNISYTDVETIISQNSLIKLANNNTTSDVVDIGFYGMSNNGTHLTYTGLFRHAGDSGKDYYLFDGYTKEDPDTHFVIDPTDASFKVSTLHANIVSQLITSNLFLAAEGGTGDTGFSFQGDGGYDTGMFSSADGALNFFANNNEIFTLDPYSFTHHTAITLANGAELRDTSNKSIILGFNLQDSGNSQRVSIGYQESGTPQTGQSWDAISIGARAGTTNQSDNAIAIGNRAGYSNQSESAVAIGGGSGGNGGAGQLNQGWSAVAIGNHAGYDTQGQNSVAIGTYAGQTTQDQRAVAIGYEAGVNSQGERTVALGAFSGANSQQPYGVAIGYNAGNGDSTPQGRNAIAIGAYAGYDHQVEYSIALNASGNSLNPDNAGLYIDPIRVDGTFTSNVLSYNTSTKEVVYSNVAISDAGITLANGTTISDSTTSGLFVDSLNFGETTNVVFYNVSTKEVTYGPLADVVSANSITKNGHTWSVDGTTGALFSDAGVYIADNSDSVVIGQNVDLTNTNTNRVTIGNNAGNSGQGYGTVAVGENSGSTNQGYLSVALGLNAGNSNQGHSSVAIGHTAGRNDQGNDAVAIGVAAGLNTQGVYAVAIGERAGYGDVSSQGDYSVAIGSKAGYSTQGAYSIILNATGNDLSTTDSGFYVSPIRYVESTASDSNIGLAVYNSSTKEVQYTTSLDGGTF